MQPLPPVQTYQGGRVLEVFSPEWDRLADACPKATVFQSCGWYRAWIETVAEAERAKPLVLAIIEGGACRAGLALQIKRDGGHCSITALSTPWADYHEALAADDDVPARAALAQAVTGLVRTLEIPVCIEDVTPNGVLAALLSEVGCRPGNSTVTAAINLHKKQSPDGLSAGHEYQIKWRRLRRLGEVRCSHHDSAPEILARLPRFIAMHSRQWNSRSDAVAAFDGGWIDRGFEAMVRHLAPRRSLLLSELLLEGEPIAMYFGFLWRKNYYGYRTTFSLAYRRLSPGHLLLQQMIADFRARGLDTLDLMRGDYGYKSSYCEILRRNTRFELAVPTFATPGTLSSCM